MGRVRQGSVALGVGREVEPVGLKADDERLELWRREQEDYSELEGAVGHDELDVERSVETFALYSYIRYSGSLGV